MNYVKYMPYHSAKNASRNRREILTALEFGFDVAVFSSDTDDSLAKSFPSCVHTIYDGSVQLTYEIPQLKRICLMLRNEIAVLRKTRKLDADFFSCHDLVSLKRAYLATKFLKKKPKLIYDSHELEIGRNTKRNKLQIWWVTHLERFLIKKCAFSIMVNDSIADEVQRIHQLEQRPIVVRSTPNLWTIDPEACAEKRKELLACMKQPRNFMLMYHGAVTSGRGIESLLEVVKNNIYVCIVILGNGKKKYIESLKEHAEQLGVTERIVFHPAVSIDELWKYVGAADVGIWLSTSKYKSYLMSLPNKFFENIQSETPVITPQHPEVMRIVEKYGIGLSCDSADYEAVNECIEKMRIDKDFYAQCKNNLKIAKQDLCWEKEKEVLIKAYKDIDLEDNK